MGKIEVGRGMYVDDYLRVTLPDGREVTICADGDVRVVDTTMGSIGNEYGLTLPTLVEIKDLCDESDDNEIPVMAHHRH